MKQYIYVVHPLLESLRLDKGFKQGVITHINDGYEAFALLEIEMNNYYGEGCWEVKLFNKI